MRIPPGQPIPFWFKLWDSNPSRFVLANITDVHGNPQAGSPFALSYSNNRGIYVGSGPNMGFINLVVDYQTYLDSGHTQLDPSYLPAADWIQPDVSPPPQLILINKPIIGIVNPNKILGSISCDITAGANVRQDKLLGFVSAPALAGRVNIPEIIQDNL